MINNNTPTFTSKFIYYKEDKIIPYYIQRVAKTFEYQTDFNKRFDLRYNGHRKNEFSFTLLDNNKEVFETTTNQEPDFLDHKSFKFISMANRKAKINERANDLKDIMFLMIKKYLLSKANISKDVLL